MRRLALILGAVVLLAGGAIALLGGDGRSTFRVDAEFDSARGMVPGQNVNVAGDKVGTVSAVKLLPDGRGGYRARMQLSLDERYAPFRADASCQILPQGIISENFVDCDPGTSATRLPRGRSGAPTVGLARTKAPLSLQSLLDIFAAPTPARMRLLINELGIGTAGRGGDLNAIMRRAAPALEQSERVLSIIAEQKDGLADAVGQTDRVLAALAGRRDDLRGFVSRSAAVLDTTARHGPALARSLRNLPPMLTSLERTLAPVERATRAGAPLLDDLRAVAPGLDRAATTVPTFARAGRPAVEAIGRASRAGRSALRPLAPVVGHLDQLSTKAQPVAETLDSLMTSLRDSGGSEALLRLAYNMAIVVSGYDSTSHFVTATPLVYPYCVIENLDPKSPSTPGCSHKFDQPDFGRTAARNLPIDSAQSTRLLKTFLDYLLK